MSESFYEKSIMIDRQMITEECCGQLECDFTFNLATKQPCDRIISSIFKAWLHNTYYSKFLKERCPYYFTSCKYLCSVEDRRNAGPVAFHRSTLNHPTPHYQKKLLTYQLFITQVFFIPSRPGNCYCYLQLDLQ